jgi:D-arabinose 5-phosphate isomerase GutQ
MPVEVEYASEFRYRNPPLDKHTLVLVITQSGETADTLAALREARRRGHKVLAICNVVGSTIAREADGGIYLHAGPEIGVASTKAFTSQVAVLTCSPCSWAGCGACPRRSGWRWSGPWRRCRPPSNASWPRTRRSNASRGDSASAATSSSWAGSQVSRWPSRARSSSRKSPTCTRRVIPAAEMKHGPIALLDEQSPCVIVVPKSALYDKTMSNLEEVRARQAPVIALATEGDTQVAAKATEVIYVPETPEIVFPLVGIVPLQLLAYHIAVCAWRRNLRRGQAAQPGQKRHGRVAVITRVHHPEPRHRDVLVERLLAHRVQAVILRVDHLRSQPEPPGARVHQRQVRPQQRAGPDLHDGPARQQAQRRHAGQARRHPGVQAVAHLFVTRARRPPQPDLAGENLIVRIAHVSS